MAVTERDRAQKALDAATAKASKAEEGLAKKREAVTKATAALEKAQTALAEAEAAQGRLAAVRDYAARHPLLDGSADAPMALTVPPAAQPEPEADEGGLTPTLSEPKKKASANA